MSPTLDLIALDALQAIPRAQDGSPALAFVSGPFFLEALEAAKSNEPPVCVGEGDHSTNGGDSAASASGAAFISVPFAPAPAQTPELPVAPGADVAIEANASDLHGMRGASALRSPAVRIPAASSTYVEAGALSRDGLPAPSPSETSDALTSSPPEKAQNSTSLSVERLGGNVPRLHAALAVGRNDGGAGGPSHSGGDYAAAPIPSAATASAPSTTTISPAQNAFAPTHADPSIREQIVAAVMSTRQETKIEVALDPPELGRVAIDFESARNGILRVTLAAETPETTDLLRRNLDLLHQMLERQGFGAIDLQMRDRGHEFIAAEVRRFAPPVVAPEGADDAGRTPVRLYFSQSRLDRLL